MLARCQRIGNDPSHHKPKEIDRLEEDGLINITLFVLKLPLSLSFLSWYLLFFKAVSRDEHKQAWKMQINLFNVLSFVDHHHYPTSSQSNSICLPIALPWIPIILISLLLLANPDDDIRKLPSPSMIQQIQVASTWCADHWSLSSIGRAWQGSASHPWCSQCSPVATVGHPPLSSALQ